MLRLALVAIIVATSSACTVRAFTPSARPLPLQTAQAPAAQAHDFQLDGTAAGEPMGPGISAGNLRYRRGVTDELAIVGDAGLMRASGDAMNESPLAGTSRVGVHYHREATDELDAAVFAGAGGGYAPSAGGWVSGDVGVMFTGDHRWIRPSFLIDVYASQPVASETFMVGEHTLRLPRTLGVQGLVGFDLGPRDRALMLGLTMGHLWAAANDHQAAASTMFLGIGAGFRFAPN